MHGRSVFISSCSRRQLARRRPSRSSLPVEALLVVVVLAAALGAFLAARGGV